MVTQSGRLCEFSVFAVLVYRGRAMSVLAPRAVNIERVVKVLAIFFEEDSATLLGMVWEMN